MAKLTGRLCRVVSRCSRSPESSGAAGAVAILGAADQIRAADSLFRPAAFRWGGVHGPNVVISQGGVAREDAGQPAHGDGQLAQPLV
jgi:hypothetical protein